MPATKNKTFKIPFSGGAAVILTVVKYTLGMQEQIMGLCTKRSADGTTVHWNSIDSMSLGVTVSAGVMTVTLTWWTGTVTDCRCCVIPGDPFA